jgi:hypothetical protein
VTTSGTTTFSATVNQIIYGALRIVGAYAVGSNPRPEQVSNAKEALDMMLKSWQMDGFLWLKQFIYITLAAATASYVIGPNSTDTVTTDAAGATAYKQRPTRIYFPTRRSIASGYEVPLLDPLSRSDYSMLPNKTTPGTPVQVFFDPGITDGMLYVWPVPPSAGDQIKCTVDRIIEDTGEDGENTLDIPPEYVRTVKFNLALEISPEYPPGMSAEDKQLALLLKEKMESAQRSGESTFFQPDFSGRG